MVCLPVADHEEETGQIRRSAVAAIERQYRWSRGEWKPLNQRESEAQANADWREAVVAEEEVEYGVDVARGQYGEGPSGGYGPHVDQGSVVSGAEASWDGAAGFEYPDSIQDHEPVVPTEMVSYCAVLV